MDLKNIKCKLEGASSKFYGHNTYVSIFYPDQQKPKWDAPLCPICGYTDPTWNKNKHGNLTKGNQSGNNKSILSVLRKIPKMIWPQKVSYYWIIGLFERKVY